MAMPPPRSNRRRVRPPRWLVVPFVITIVALLVDASVHSRSPKAGTALTNAAWVDKVLPYITASNEQGGEIARLATSSLPAGPKAAVDELEAVAAAAKQTYRSVVAADPPQEVTAAAGLLQACLAAREQGTAQMASAAEDLLRGGPVSSSVASMSAAIADFQVSDNAYQLFVQASRSIATMPSSRWVSPGSFSASALSSFARRLQPSTGKTPTQAIAIDAISTTPPPLSLLGKVEVLSPASSFSVTVVIANDGTSTLTGAAVTVTVSPARAAASQQASKTFDLAPGQSLAVTFAGFVPPPSTPVTVTVGATLPGSSQPSASKRFEAELPGPNFPGAGASTTTTGSPTSTTGSTASSTSSSAPTSTTSTT
jgi:hypothetical protein